MERGKENRANIEKEAAYFTVSSELNIPPKEMVRIARSMGDFRCSYAVDSDNFRIYLSGDFHQTINDRHGSHLNFGGSLKLNRDGTLDIRLDAFGVRDTPEEHAKSVARAILAYLQKDIPELREGKIEHW